MTSREREKFRQCVGEVIRREMEKLGETRRGLAEKMRVSPTHLGRVIHGERGLRDFQLVTAAWALCLAPAELMGKIMDEYVSRS